MKTRSQLQLGGAELQTGSVRNRQEVQSGLEQGEASGVSLGNGTTRTTKTPSHGRNASQEMGLAQQNVVVPRENMKPCTRKKWSKEENTDIMRAYFHATKCDREKQGFRKKLVIEWRRLRPDSSLNESQLANQLYAIKTRKLLSELEIRQIKQQTEQLLNLNNPDNRTAEIIEDDQENSEDQVENLNTTLNDNNNTEKIKIINAFETNLIQYGDILPERRPRLPKIKPNKKTKLCMDTLNEALPLYLKHEDTLERTHAVVYNAALTAIQHMGVQSITNENLKRREYQPKWKKRIENKINTHRSILSKINEWERGNNSKKLKKEVKKYLRSNNIAVGEPTYKNKIASLKDNIKQKIAMWGKRLRRYNKSFKRKKDNNLFSRNEKCFYKQLEQRVEANKMKNPDVQQLTDFWKKIWAEKGKHNAETEWLKMEKERCANVPQMTPLIIHDEEVRNALRKSHNWKAAGIDHIHNFWWKKVNVVEVLTDQINRVINQQLDIPEFLTRGMTVMVPKTEQTENPKNYRPITCLPTLYKIITSILSTKISKHLELNGILSEEQKGCRYRSQGCKEQLTIDAVCTQDARLRMRNIAVAWIDYQKAFDSVPHSWLIECLKLYKIDPKIINILSTCMKNWRTQLRVTLGGETITTEEIPIRSGIFQGDALSPIWFILSLNPLSWALKSTGIGYELKSEQQKYTLNHLFYVDDLKLYAGSEQALNRLIEIAERFSDDIRMKFGLDKCAKLIALKGKSKTYADLQEEHEIKYLNKEMYKYLGYEQNLTVDQRNSKDTAEKKTMQRVRKLLGTQLTGGNMMKAINTWAIPVITYTFGILKWSATDLESLNRKIRTAMTENRAHHPRACIERLYLPRTMGGRGLADLKVLHDKQVNGLRKFFHKKRESSSLHRLICMSDRYSILQLKKSEHKKIPTVEEMKTKWLSKPLHGRYPGLLSTAEAKGSVQWLTSKQLFMETEGFITAIQDNIIATRNYKKYIQKIPIENDKCRMCQTTSETIEHIISGCQTLANTEYLKRHNLTSNIIHQKLAHFCHLKEDEVPYYKYIPEPVLENTEYRLYWDTTIVTDKPVANNRPDITLVDKANKTAYFIDISHPLDHNLEQKEAEKVNKYYDLCEEYKQILSLKAVHTIPIIISATGLVTKKLQQYLQQININEKSILVSMQKSVILETCRIVRKTLNIPEA